jgi:hypothetical protein
MKAPPNTIDVAAASSTRLRAQRRPRTSPGGDRCAIAGCVRDIAVKKHNLCEAHYRRYLRTGAPGSAKVRRRRSLHPYRAT